MEKDFSRNTSRSMQKEVYKMHAQTQRSIIESAIRVLQTNNIVVENFGDDLLPTARNLLRNETFWMNLPNGLHGLKGHAISKYTVRREFEIAVEEIDTDD